MLSHQKNDTLTATPDMDVTILPYPTVPQLGPKDVAYATQNPALRPFYQYNPTLDAFKQTIDDKSGNAIDREILVDALRKQYQGLEIHPSVKLNIELLASPNTFVIVTAHQPSLFTGPLFYWYKIFTAINLAEELRMTYPDYSFVPVLVNGAEDHDFDEINHANLFGKTLRWEHDAVGGSCGDMSTATLAPVLAQLKEVLGESENGSFIYQQIESAYTGHELYADATIDLVNRLFGKYGLVALNMNIPAFKRLFIPIMREELFQQSSQALISVAQEALTAAGFSGQAHARDINLFYLQPNRRDRIVRDGDFFNVLNTDLRFTPAEMEAELEAHPEKFSPNVVLRPLFQELILPNLAYVGGGGEIAYWLERKSQFAHFGINFPVLMRRNSLLWIDKATSGRMEKLSLRVQDLFIDTEFLIKQYVALNSEGELSLQSEMAQLKTLFEQVRLKALSVDPTLEKAVLAEAVKQEKVLEQLEGRLVRAEKQKHETGINQIRSLKEKLFPGNGLQERTDNFLNFYMKYGEGFGEALKEVVDPFVEGFVVVRD